MSEEVFSVEQAEALLPVVAPLVEQLSNAHAEMEELQEQVTASAPTNGGGDAHRRFSDAGRRASEAIAELERKGILIRDPGSGLIDFPSERAGRPVFLCWRLGEERLGWWHPPDTGFAGRRPL